MKEKTQKQIDKEMGFKDSQSASYNHGNRNLTFQASKDGYSTRMLIVKYPTNNCQMSSIGEMRSILQVRSNATRRLYYLTQRLRSMTQRQILIDVPSREYAGVIKRLAPYTTIVNEFPYTSSNSSKMHLALLKWTI